MELMEWRHLAVQSVILLLAAIVCSTFLSGRLQTGNTVLADTGKQKQERKILQEEKESVADGQKMGQFAAEESEIQGKRSKKKIIVIDAGHGGMDEGTSSSDRKCLEKEYTLRTSLRLCSLLRQNGVRAYCTRTSDKLVSKKSRLVFAKRVKADLMVSVHCNASVAGDHDSKGIEVLYSSRKSKPFTLANMHLAKILFESLGKEVPLKKRGIIQRNHLYLLHHAKMPAAIVEIGYITNRDDMRYIMDGKGQQKIAQGICNGILKALEELK